MQRWFTLPCATLLCAILPCAILAMLFSMAALPATAIAAAPSGAPDLAVRLEQHVRAVASVEHNTRRPAELEQAARYIESTLIALGYQLRRQEYFDGSQQVRNIEVALRARTGAGADASAQPPARIIIVGAHYDSARGAPGANDNGSGTAALLELARLLRTAIIAPGTELKLVWYVNEEPPHFGTDAMGSWRHAQALKEANQPVQAVLILETIGYYTSARNSQRYPPGLAALYPDTGNFLAFVSTLGSGALLRKTLASFRLVSRFPAQGLVAPGLIDGVTWSDHTSYNQHGYPAIMITDTAFLRYPHYHTAADTPDKLDYASLAQVVTGLELVVRDMLAPFLGGRQSP